eukprot:CAMPEP_0177584110 /NCGR_PEP_ID=MMETSP0419_2-20121207/3711_1 /TAXON_ID=582737 /ORGANISM="Tetraselmis sp., Strain GSL018" /LENGTH=137 /DNA_ID=CAMNT_0019073607 /DNA_START=521 /DNA_END=934 /DNA_ORIENTATION=-
MREIRCTAREHTIAAHLPCVSTARLLTSPEVAMQADKWTPFEPALATGLSSLTSSKSATICIEGTARIWMRASALQISRYAPSPLKARWLAGQVSAGGLSFSTAKAVPSPCNLRMDVLLSVEKATIRPSGEIATAMK